MGRVLLATLNKGKVRELQAMLGDLVDVVTLDDVERPEGEVEETATTFEGNAILKAVAYGRVAGEITLADDSGLEVDALGGEPGVYSARWAGKAGDDAANNALLLARMADVPDEDRTGRFRCTVAVYLPPGTDVESVRAEVEAHPQLSLHRLGDGEREWVIVSAGHAEGRILRTPRGHNGFGYDPLFLSDDLDVTFAEASIEAKRTVSHRGRAFANVAAVLRSLAG